MQDYTEAGNLRLKQNKVVSSGNTHGVNYATANQVGTTSSIQSVTVTGDTTFVPKSNNTGGNNTQVGNSASSTIGRGSSAINSVQETTQTFTSRRW